MNDRVEVQLRCVFRGALGVVATLAFVGCATDRSPLEHPDTTALAAAAPDSFRVSFVTSKGTFVVEAHRKWAPHGVDRFYHLVSDGFYDEARFFRVVDGFMAQFGINGAPRVTAQWSDMTIPDDSVATSNRRGYVTFAKRGIPNSRTTQLFINLVDNANLDKDGFAPIGLVVEGMTVVDSLFSGYGDSPPYGNGPLQDRIVSQGNAYLLRDFPRLDYIRSARVAGATSSPPK